MRHIIPISGKDSLATAILQQQLQPEFDYEFVFNPTGSELPEVFEWIDNVELYLGKKIIQVGKDLENIIVNEYNYFLPSHNARYCTRQSKIEPFVEWIGNDPAIAYYGIRADEEREGFNNKTAPNITPKYPLQKAGINLSGVYIIINAVGLKPPTFFWDKMHQRVCEKLGFDPREILPEWMFDMLFAGRTRANCFMCYQQRLSEWVWLSYEHPNLFWKAESFEHLGSDGTFSWNSNKTLKQIYDERDRIFENRSNQICKAIRRFEQYSIFEDDGEKEILDVLSIKSCGLFCGK
jgi:hypothetical protein